jgi:hypothetical protein
MSRKTETLAETLPGLTEPHYHRWMARLVDKNKMNLKG